MVVGESSRFTPWTGFNSVWFGGAEHVDIPVPGGGLHVLLDPGGSSSSAVSRDQRGEWVFQTFHRVKKVRSLPRFRVRSWWRRSAHGPPAGCEAHHVGRGGDALQGFVPGLSSAALLGGPQGLLPGQSSTRGVRLSDAVAHWQAQDPGLEFWPNRACRFFLQGGCQQGQACTFARSVHRLHPDAPWEEFMQLFRVGERDAGGGFW